MKAISLWQPWATFWALGIKKNETRSWPCAYRGPIAIHAAQHWDQDQRDLFKEWPFTEIMTQDPAIEFPRGVIVGRVDLVACHATAELVAANGLSKREYALGGYGPGRYAWMGDNHQLFDATIPYKGKQGFFNVPATELGMDEPQEHSGPHRGTQGVLPGF